jgi:hypothetical protein
LRVPLIMVPDRDVVHFVVVPSMGLGVCGSLYRGWIATWGGVHYI